MDKKEPADLAALPQPGDMVTMGTIERIDVARDGLSAALESLTEAAAAFGTGLAELRGGTGRPISPGAEAMLGKVHRVLDHGEVELVDYMGTDEHVARVARVSTGSKSEDLGILGYLVRSRHTSPIEFAELTVRVKLPIFLARQWIRHRTASVSEASARYKPMPREAYVPADDYVQAAPGKAKQGRGADLELNEVQYAQGRIVEAHRIAREIYDELRAAPDAVHDADVPPLDFPGVANELARSVLTLGQYTEWYWKIDAHNLMNFLRLRDHDHAQKEIRPYAKALDAIFAAWLPKLHAAYRSYVLLSRALSEKELRVLGALLGAVELLWGDGSAPRLREEPAIARLCEQAGLKGGELDEFAAKLGLARDLAGEQS